MEIDDLKQQAQNAYTGDIVGGMISEAARWKAEAIALQAEVARLKAALAKEQTSETT